jgi:hypothetical protein
VSLDVSAQDIFKAREQVRRLFGDLPLAAFRASTA